MKAIKAAVAAALVVFACAALASCNTVRGLGQDIEKGGEKIQRSVDGARH